MIKDNWVVFEDFKRDFYSKVKDFTILNFGNYNALKIVLDALKMEYSKKYNSRNFLFYPLWLYKLILYTKYYKYKPKSNPITSKNLNAEVLLLDFSGRYVINEAGKSIPFYFEDLLQVIGREKCMHIVVVSKTEKINYLVECSKLLYLRYSSLTKKEIKLRKELLDLFTQIQKSNYFAPAELKSIQHGLNSFFEQVNFWNHFLRNASGIKCAIIEMHYGNEALIYSLKEKKIPVYEIQHGLISIKDIFYVFPSETSNIINRALFPDKIFVQGQYWKDVLLKGADYKAAPENIMVLGDFFYKKASILPQQRKDVFNFKLSSNLILICTQTFMQDDFIPYIKWLSKDLLEKKLNYKIIVKHHPVEKRETYQSLLSLENVLLCNYNLSFLFETCKIHISIYSTTLFDALQYNLHNFTLESSFSEDYRSEIIKDKIARPIKRNENPVLLLKEQETEKVDAGYFYAPFSQEKLKKILNYK